MMPWTDRTGHFSPLKTGILMVALLPATWLTVAWALGWLQPRPFDALIHQTGLWAIRLFWLSLAITPLRQLWGWTGLVKVRRIVGVVAFGYAALHLTAYAMDQAFDLGRILSELLRRSYLTIGLAGLVILALLAATSTDGMVRRLGGRAWQRLHRLAYPAAVLAAVHFFLQSKLDVTEPLVMAGLLAWLFGYRAWRAWTGRAGSSAWVPLGLAAAATLVTAAGEAAWLAVSVGVDPWLVLAANLSPEAGLRPAWAVGFGALATAIIAWVRQGRERWCWRPAASPQGVR